MDLSQHHLLRLPPEIRLRVYSFLFAVKGPILLGVYSDGRIYQPSNDAMRNHKENPTVQISGQFFRTCRQVYHEAWAYLFSYNRFEILDIHTHHLEKAQFTLATRALMNKIDFLNRTENRLNLTAIGICFPSLKTVNIHTRGPGAHLSILAYEYARALPCSNIRSWPTLELHINVPSSGQANVELETELDNSDSRDWKLNQNAKDTAKIQTMFQNRRTFKLAMFEPYVMPVFKLGSEMPELGTIALHGVLHKDHVRAVENYESTYGDCAFEFVRKEAPAEVPGWGGKFIKKVYVWKRKDGHIPNAVRGMKPEDLASLMGQWVPKLSPEFVKAMKEAGF